MENLNRWGLQYASQQELQISVEQIVDDVLSTIRPLLIQSVLAFLTAPLTATSFMQLALALLSRLCVNSPRNLLQSLLQSLETSNGWTAPR